MRQEQYFQEKAKERQRQLLQSMEQERLENFERTKRAVIVWLTGMSFLITSVIGAALIYRRELANPARQAARGTAPNYDKVHPDQAAALKEPADRYGDAPAFIRNAEPDQPESGLSFGWLSFLSRAGSHLNFSADYTRTPIAFTLNQALERLAELKSSRG